MALAVTMILAGPWDTGWGWGLRIGPDQDTDPLQLIQALLIKANVTLPIPHTLSVSGLRILVHPPTNKNLVHPLS